MKKILAFLLVLVMCFAAFTCCADAKQVKVMTSFYPVHIFALNVFEGIDAISVDCMTAPQTGCLHDYQLVVSDMMKLAESDLFIVCGAGMEPYLEDVTQQFPHLPVAECSEGLMFLDDCGLMQDHDHDHDHDHAVNTHVWLDIDNAIGMVDAIARSGCEQFAEYAEQITGNANAYKARLQILKEEISSLLMPLQGKQVVAFHEAFAYFVHAYGIEVLASVNHESENGMSPAELSMVIRYVDSVGAPPLFAEDASAASPAHTVASETGTRVYNFDSIVTGDANLSAYEDRMLANAQSVLSAFE